MNDKERLDWLESHPRDVIFGEGYRGEKGSWTYRGVDLTHHTAASLRDAIDSARDVKEGAEQ